MVKYVARARSSTCDGNDFYRYFHASGLEKAKKRLGGSYKDLFNDLPEPDSPVSIICLELKEVGRNKQWHTIFDRTQICLEMKIKTIEDEQRAWEEKHLKSKTQNQPSVCKRIENSN